MPFAVPDAGVAVFEGLSVAFVEAVFVVFEDAVKAVSIDSHKALHRSCLRIDVFIPLFPPSCLIIKNSLIPSLNDGGQGHAAVKDARKYRDTRR